MRKSIAFIIAATFVLAGIAAASWRVAGSKDSPSSGGPTPDNYIALHQLEEFVGYLQETKQTNALERFGDYANVMLVSRSTADLGIRLRILADLRNGYTNEAIHMLELQVRSDLVTFAGSYRQLPPSIREKVNLAAVNEAREYCARYPATTDQDVSNMVFTLLSGDVWKQRKAE